MAKTVSDEKLLASLKRIERFAVWTDSLFRIPFTQIRFGLDSIIGLVPVLGETIGFILSMYLIVESYKLGLPLSLKIKMLRNAALDWLIGIVPILGDIGDIAFKANMRNMEILVGYVNSEYQRRHNPPPQKPNQLYKYISVLVLLSLMIILSAVLVTQF